MFILFCCSSVSYYANDFTVTSEGSLFHGMKVLAMPQRRFGTV